MEVQLLAPLMCLRIHSVPEVVVQTLELWQAWGHDHCSGEPGQYLNTLWGKNLPHCSLSPPHHQVQHPPVLKPYCSVLKVKVSLKRFPE